MAYISPIELTLKRISEELIEKQEEQVLQAIYQQGITVNKEELIKALAYDRHQYEQGFRDGQESIKEALKKAFRNNCCHNCYYCKFVKWDKKDACHICGLIDIALTGEEAPE